MKLKDLQERRALIVAEMRSITDKPAGNGGDLSAEQSARFDALKLELQNVEKSAERQAFIDETERRMQGRQVHGTGDNRLDEELRGFSLRRAICSMIPDLAAQIDTGRERELSNEIAKRSGRTFTGMAVPLQVFQLERRTVTSQFASPDAGGANLVGTDLRADQFIDVLRAKLVIRRLGARVLSGLMGGVDIPKLSGSASASWVDEDADLSQGDPGFSKIQLQPRHCGAMTEFSRNMLLQSSPDIEQLIRQDFAKILANALDVAALNGSGNGIEPRGILNLSGLPTVTGALSWSKVLEMVETIEEANTEPSGWVSTPGMKRLLRSTQKVSGGTDATMIMESGSSLADLPFMATTNAPSALGSPAESDALILGDWADLLIGIWSEFDLLVNPYESAAYKRGNTKVRGMMTVDVAARHTESFVAMTSVSPG